MAKGANYVLDKGYILDGTSAYAAYTVVKFGSDDNHAAASTAASDAILGVLQENVDADKAGKYVAAIRLLGISKAKAGGTVAAGDQVTANSSGQVIATTTSGNSVVGTALSSGASGDLIDVLLTPSASV